MIVIGLTGGIGSGKSTALMRFKKLGAHVVSADKLAREAVRRGAPAYREIRKKFGAEFFHRNNILDRKKLARKVFKNKKDLKTLNAIIHPVIFSLERTFIKKTAKKEKSAVIVIDAALMIETGSHKWKDAVVVIDCSKENCVKRLLKKKRFKKAEIEARMDAQMPLRKKLEAADYVIDNNGTIAQFRKNVDEVFRKITGKK